MLSRKTTRKDVRRLVNQTDSANDKNADLQVYGLVSANERQFLTQISNPSYAITSSPAGGKGQQIELIQEPLNTGDLNLGHFSEPSLEDIFTGMNTGKRQALEWDPESGRRIPLTNGEFIDTSKPGLAFDFMPGDEDAGYQIEQYMKSLGKVEERLYPVKAIEGNGGSSIQNYPIYSVQEIPLVKSYPITFVSASDDSVQKLQTIQNQRYTDHFGERVLRKQAVAAAQNASLNRALQV